MSGFNNKFGQQSKPAARTNYAQKNGSTAKDESKKTIAGLYEHVSKTGAPSKLVMKGTAREDITIKAGQQVKIFVQGGLSKNGKELPPFQLIVQDPQVRS